MVWMNVILQKFNTTRKVVLDPGTGIFASLKQCMLQPKGRLFVVFELHRD